MRKNIFIFSTIMLTMLFQAEIKGVTQSALYFSQSRNILLGDPLSTGGSSSLSVWIFLEGQHDSSGYIFSNYAGGDTYHSMMLQNDRKVQFYSESQGGASSSSISVGQWINLVFVKDIDNDKLIIYKNGDSTPFEEFSGLSLSGITFSLSHRIGSNRTGDDK